MARPFSITAIELFAELFDDHPPVVIDLRIAEDVQSDPCWLPGSRRLEFDDLEGHLAETAPGQDVVTVCQKGLKLSQGAAARLIQQGRRAHFLEGGVLAWRAAELPMAVAGPKRWVSDGGDRLAAWLARRLLPRPSEFLEVDADQVPLVAERFSGQVLPSREAFFALFDRPMPAVRETLEFAQSGPFHRILAGAPEQGFEEKLWDSWTRAAIWGATA